MFEFFFKFPAAAFQKGRFVLAGGWPAWVLAAIALAALGVLVWQLRRGHGAPRFRFAVAALQALFVALVLLLLWRPALSVASLKPQENVIAVVVDDSRSMALRDDAATRIERAKAVLSGGLLTDLRKRFQIRLYAAGRELRRVEDLSGLHADSGASRIADSLHELALDSTNVPLGAVVLLSDGADTAGGIGLDTVSELRRRRIPVHTIGFGAERAQRDVEINDATAPERALAGSRVNVAVALRSTGFDGQKARLAVRDAGKLLAAREIALTGGEQSETIALNAGEAGAKALSIGVEPLAGEDNARNNAVSRLTNVEAARPRILYIEGEPRWEFKFIRRALEDDRSVQLVSILRTTENKNYRQGIDRPDELQQGFPGTAEELFAYQGLIIGSVESAYFTAAQQDLIREFVNRRGGGVLFLGGRTALAEGGWARPPLGDLLPVSLPARAQTFHREPAKFELTAAGRESLACRLVDDPRQNADRWKTMPLLADYQEVAEAKPGALVLAEFTIGRRTMPLLVTQNFGRGRTAVFATSGSWRWKMGQDHNDRTHQVFWQQMLRWLVTGTPGPVKASVAQSLVADTARAMLRAEVRDKAFRPVSDAHVEARLLGPDGLSETVELRPEAEGQGAYSAEWTAAKPGSYLAEIAARRGTDELGRDVATFLREDGVAENFHTEQNRALLEQLAGRTGGRYWTPKQAAKLAAEISYSEAGITVRETHDLWDMPAFLLLVLAVRSSEWLLRRKRGAL